MGRILVWKFSAKILRTTVVRKLSHWIKGKDSREAGIEGLGNDTSRNSCFRYK